MRSFVVLPVLVVFLFIGLDFAASQKNTDRVARNKEQEQLYKSLCLDGSTAIETMWDGDAMRRMCICGALRDMKPLDPTIQSIRANSFVKKVDFSSSIEPFVDGEGIPCVDGYVKTPNGDYSCSGVDLLSFVSYTELEAYGQLSSLWGWTDGVYEIALVGTYSGIALVDVSIPTNPRFIGIVHPPSNGLPNLWHDVKVYKDHAYMVSESGNMQYINMTKIIKNTLQTANTTIPINLMPYVKEFGNTSLTRTHTLGLNEETGFAYLAAANFCGRGLYMVDVRDPGNPKEASCFGDDGYVHEVQCVIYRGQDVRYRDKEICFMCNEDTVTIVDVSDKTNPTLLSLTTYTGAAYTHQGWLNENHDYFVFGDELDERYHTSKTLVLEVKDLVDPKLIGYHLSSKSATDHNQYIIGDYSYQANYHAGFRVLKMDDLSKAKFTEVAYFDTYPLDDERGFNGAWMVYPFFPSGNILISDMEQGLFVLKANKDKFQPLINGSCSYDRRCRNTLIPMYKKERLLFGFCRTKCVRESFILQAIENGWTCGKCRNFS